MTAQSPRELTPHLFNCNSHCQLSTRHLPHQCHAQACKPHTASHIIAQHGVVAVPLSVVALSVFTGNVAAIACVGAVEQNPSMNCARILNAVELGVIGRTGELSCHPSGAQTTWQSHHRRFTVAVGSSVSVTIMVCVSGCTAVTLPQVKSPRDEPITTTSAPSCIEQQRTSHHYTT